MVTPPSSPPPYSLLSSPSSSPSSSKTTINSPTTTNNSPNNNHLLGRGRNERSGGLVGGKPKWLLALYVLFGFVCMNAVVTYQRQKRLVRASSLLRKNYTDDDSEEFGSTGAEEHVISANYGSSMYGGGIHTTRSKTKKKKKTSETGAKAKSINPKPSDGRKDLNRKRHERRTNFNAFSLYIMTDTPYTDWQEKRLRSQMADLRDYVKASPDRNITFGVHLGGTIKPSNTLCAETAYERIAALIGKGPRPTLVVPGNNDWYDCPRRDESWSYFMKYYGPSYVETEWHSEHYDILNIARSADHPELFTLYYEGILFIGIHLLDAPTGQESKSDWDDRLHMDKEWVARNVESCFTNLEVRGVVVFGHGKYSARTKPFFTSMSKYFLNITTREKVPVMYVHGDGLTHKVDRSFGTDAEWQYYYDVQVHPSGLADPVLLDVAPQRSGDTVGLEEESDAHTTFGEGLFRIDRRQGVYADPMDIK